MALAPGVEAWARCMTQEERVAAQVRAVQTELMVAALSCRAVPGRDFTAHYNAFVQKHGERLIHNGRVLQGYFKARFGAQSGSRFDSFMTALANDLSRRSMASATFCDESVGLFQEIARLERKDLETWSGARSAPQVASLDKCATDKKRQRASAGG